MIIAALRQGRTTCPRWTSARSARDPTGLTSEVPAPDYDVVVFENRFPSLAGQADVASSRRPTATDFVTAPGNGRCEVIVFSSDHTGSFAELELPHARLVVEAWRHRTEDLMGRPGIEQVVLLREPRRGGRA